MKKIMMTGIMAMTMAWMGTDACEAGEERSLQDELQFLQAETQVVEAATKTTIPINKAPGSITVINYAQIRKSSARTIPDLLRMVPGVNVRWNPMMQTIDMRGFGGNPFTSRVLLLVDGVPYNSWNKGGFPQQPGLDFFVLQNVKRLEVIRDPGSVLYGENAYWGVINIVTLSGEDIQGGKVAFRGGSLNTREGRAIYGDTIGDDGSFLFSAKNGQSQMPMKFWQTSNSKVRSNDVFAKGKYKDVTLSFYRHDDAVGGFTEVVPPIPFVRPLAGGSVFQSAPKIVQRVEIAAVKVDHTTANKDFTFRANVSWARRNGMHCGSCHAFRTSTIFSQPADHGQRLDADFNTSIRAIPYNDILVGTDMRWVNSKQHSQELGAGATGIPVVPSYKKPSFYLQDQVSLFDNTLQIIGGVRMDNKSTPSLYARHYSPRLAVVYNYNDALTFRAGWSKAFRTPSFSELYQNSGFFTLKSNTSPAVIPLSVFNPNPNLRAEETQTYDAGVTYTPTPSLKGKISIFYSQVNNFIVRTETPNFSKMTFENHPAEGRIYGTELEVNWEATNRLSAFANWSFQNEYQVGTSRDSTGKMLEFTYAPKHKINGGVNFRPFTGFSGALEVSWRSQVIAPSFWYAINNPADPTIRPFGTYTDVNLRLNYDLPLLRTGEIRRPLRLSFFMRNLLDQKHKETLTGVNTTVAGRQFYGQAEYSF